MPIINQPLCLLSLYEKFISDTKKGKRLQPNGKPISRGTVQNYYYSFLALKRFASEKQFELRIKPVRRLSTRELVAERNYWKKFYRRFTDYLYDDCGYFDNYTGLTIKNIRTFFNYLNKELILGVGDFHKLFYVRKEEIAIFPLMPEELHFLIHDEVFEKNISPRMREVKDFFVFGCTVALRVSDLLALKKSNIRIANGQYYLAVRSLKTATDSLIKLPTYAVTIIQRYDKNRKRVLPKFNAVNLNKYIKLLLEQAGFTQPVYKTRSKRGIVIEIKNQNPVHQQLRFSDLATTHTMRRTAITTMLSLGVPEQVVRKISGHSPSGKEFYRYVLWAQVYQDQETEKMFNKLGEKRLIIRNA